jgi:excisionase family DNA binding protein
MIASRMEKDLMSKAELMQYLSVSRATLDRLMKTGLPYIKISSGKRGAVRFKRRDIDRWLESKRVK